MNIALCLGLLLGVHSLDPPRWRVCLNGEWDLLLGGGMERPPEQGKWQPFPVPGFVMVNLPSRREFLPSRGWREWAKALGNPWHCWYRLEFPVPAEWEGKAVILRFDAVSHYAKVFVNRRLAGEFISAFLPVEVDITRFVNFGVKNMLHVLVVGSSISEVKGVKGWVYTDWCPKAHDRLCLWRGMGIWQDVWLEARPKVYISDTFVQTSVRRKEIKVECTVRNDTNRRCRLTLDLQVLLKGKVRHRLPRRNLVIPARGERKVTLKSGWENPLLWGIGGEYGKPVLYLLRSRLLRGEEVVDETFQKFGFREFWIRGTDFLLNGKPIRLQGDSILGSYSLAENARDFVARLFRFLRGANYNLVRLHGMSHRPFSSTWFEVADEVGMLLKPEFWTPGGCPSPFQDDERYWRNVKGQVRNFVMAYRNHPSIVLWSADNEGASNFWALRRVLEVGKVIESADPTRIVDYEGEMGAVSFYLLPRVKVVNLHYPSDLLLEDWRERFGKPVIIGECMHWGAFKIVLGMTKGDPAKAYHEMAEWVRREIPRYKNLGISGISPFCSRRWFFWRPPHWEGPWGGEKSPLPIPWPALSGPGPKPRFLVRNYGFLTLNWFDPSAPEHIVTEIYEAVRQCFDPMPQMKELTLPPEVIVKVYRRGRALPHAVVFARRADRALLSVEGVMADREGRAWLCLPEEGKWEIWTGGKSLLLDAKRRKIPLKPGMKVEEVILNL